MDQVNKQQKNITGGNVNYYLINVIDSKNLQEYVVEVEDIIEALNMEFAEGTIFKSLVRLCKLRQNLGKPGSTQKYEAEKIKYYADRVLVKAQRRENKSVIRYVREDDKTINIPNPKRLPPYIVGIDDMIKALDMKVEEELIFKNLVQLCIINVKGVDEAEKIKHYAKFILDNF